MPRSSTAHPHSPRASHPPATERLPLRMRLRNLLRPAAWRDFFDLVRRAGEAWVDDRAASMGAALSYYTVFSIAPLLLIAISVAGLVFGRDAARGAVVGQLAGMIGDDGAKIVQDLLRSVSSHHQGVIATVVGVVLLVFGATSVLAELQDDLNRIWEAPPAATPSGVWGWVRGRLLSIGLILAMGFLLLVSLAASAAIQALGDWSTSFIAGWDTLAEGINFVLSYGLVTALFGIIYRFMPQVRIHWRDVWIGAAVTAFLFTVGKYLIGLYLGKSAVTSGFGAAGSLAVLLLWVYYSAQIFLLGAEFTWVYAHERGSRSRPKLAVAAVPPLAVRLPAGRAEPAATKAVVVRHRPLRKARNAVVAGAAAAAAVVAADAIARKRRPE